MTDKILTRLNSTSDKIIKVAAIVGAITIIAGGYTWYLNTIWKPNVQVTQVDFKNGIALIKYGSKIIDLEGDATYWLNADWGIRFGSIRRSDGSIVYDRLELLKKGMVVEYLKK
jgi:hypothetical protein